MVSQPASRRDRSRRFESLVVGSCRYNLGFTLHAADNLLEAVRAFQKAIGCKEDYAEAHNNLGVVLRKLDDYEGAVKSYQRVPPLPITFGQTDGLAAVSSRAMDESRAERRSKAVRT